MPKSAKYQKIYENMIAQYGEKKGKQVYYAWLNEHGKDDTKSVESEGLFFKHVMPLQKSQDEEGETIYTGVASSTSVDRDTERLSKSALEKGAKDLMKNPTVFFNHKHDGLGVGLVKNAYVTGDKLHVEWTPSKAPGVKDVIMQVNEGILRSMSIGGKVKDYDSEYDSKLEKDVKVITDLDLYEVSVVGIPANPDATISSSIHKAFDFEKSRIASSVNDDNDEVKGDGGEIDEKEPIVPPKKKKAKDKEIVSDDEVYESAKRKGKGKSALVDFVKEDKIVRRAPRKLELRCPNCGEMHKVKCPYCDSLHIHPEGPDAPVKYETGEAPQEYKSVGDAMTLVKCVSCGEKFPLEKNLVTLKKEEEDEEEEEEEDEDEEEYKKPHKKKKSAETTLQKENQRPTPNEPDLPSPDSYPEDLSRYEGLVRHLLSLIEGKKKVAGKVSGDSHGAPVMPAKSASDEDLKKLEELKNQVAELEKKVDSAKGLANVSKFEGAQAEQKPVMVTEGQLSKFY